MTQAKFKIGDKVQEIKFPDCYGEIIELPLGRGQSGHSLYGIKTNQWSRTRNGWKQEYGYGDDYNLVTEDEFRTQELLELSP